MNKSIFIARVMGLFLLILSLALLLHSKNLEPIVNIIFQNLALQFILGMILLLIGVLLVVSHNVWNYSWVVVITILSWLILFKGVLYLFFPECVQRIAQTFVKANDWMYLGGLINLLIGVYLCYMGFFDHKEVKSLRKKKRVE